MSFVEVKGKKIFFAEEGIGRKGTVVLVHGAGCNHKVWLAQLKGLSENYRIIAVDLPGHGASEGSSRSDISGYTQFIHEFAKAVVKAGKFYLGGHSMGGAVTLNYALEYQEDLAGIILVATGSRLRVNKTVLATYQKGEHYEQLIDYAISKNAPKSVKTNVQEIKSECPPRVCFDDYTACDSFDVSVRLGEVRVPALIVCGEEDLLTPLKYSQFLAQLIPGSKLRTTGGSGHFIPVEKPDFLNKTINDFLDSLREV